VFVFRPSTLRKLGTLLFTLLVLELAEEGGARERGAETQGAGPREHHLQRHEGGGIVGDGVHRRRAHCRDNCT